MNRFSLKGFEMVYKDRAFYAHNFFFVPIFFFMYLKAFICRKLKFDNYKLQNTIQVSLIRMQIPWNETI